MYRNIGKKIKGLAIAVFILEILLYVGLGIILIVLMNEFEEPAVGVIIGLLTIGLGFLFSWISTWQLYGFGELIDKMAEVERNTRCFGERTPYFEPRGASGRTYGCPTCGRQVFYGEPKCKSCGQSFHWQ